MSLKSRLADPSGAGTSGQQGDNAAGAGDSGKGNEAEVTKLRQQIADLQRDAEDAVPFVRGMKTLATLPVGEAIIEKLQKGEDLTGYELKKVEKAIDDATGGGEKPITRKELEELQKAQQAETVNVLTERLQGMRAAEKSNDRLEGWATKELPGYAEFKDDERWKEHVGTILTAVDQKTIRLPRGEDPWQFVFKRAYNLMAAEDPDIAKGERPSAANEDDRLREILVAGTKPSGSDRREGEPDISGVREGYYERMLDFAKKRGSGAIAGDSYADRGSKGE